MGTLGIFVIGVLVTLLVASALALVLFGAVLDGRRQQRVDDGLEPEHDGDLELARGAQR